MALVFAEAFIGGHRFLTRKRNQMGTLRKLRKSIKEGKKPIIMFIADPKQTYKLATNKIFDAIGEPVITVTDEKLYERLLEGVRQAQQTDKHNIEEINND